MLLLEPEGHVVEIEREPFGLGEQIVTEVPYAALASDPGKLLYGDLRRAQGQQTACDGQFQLR